MNPILAPIRWLARSRTRAFVVLFVLGFSLRVGVLTLIPPDLIPPNPNWETGAVAFSLVERGEFADPYLIPTGPTAHMPPLQVSLFALLYKLLGYSHLGGLIRWLLVSGAHAATFALLPWVGDRIGVGREVGVAGGLGGALAVHWPYELESFSALVLVLLLMAFLGRWGRGPDTRERVETRRASTSGSIILGLAAGISFHLQPALLPVVLGCLLFELWWRREAGARRQVAILTLAMVLACIPWSCRNHRTLGEPFFVRSNLGLELYVGNHDGAHGDIDVSVARRSFRHPRTDLAEAERLRDLGEAEYMRQKKEEALEWITSNPGRFLKLTASRIAYFWGGPVHRFPASPGALLLTALALLGAWRILPTLSPPQRAALLIPLSTYPLIYYIVAYMPRYGYPIRWILFLLAGGAVWAWIAGETPGGKPAADPRGA
ncbi:MAG: hypothetical protein ACWGSQ_04535 [Longimicrobiales bacterium]